MTFDMNQTVSEIASENPAAVPVFENFGIDYCCGGKRSLQEACEGVNAPIDQVMQALSELPPNNMRPEEPSGSAICPAAIERRREAAPAIGPSTRPWRNSSAIFTIIFIWKTISCFRAP